MATMCIDLKLPMWLIKKIHYYEHITKIDRDEFISDTVSKYLNNIKIDSADIIIRNGMNVETRICLHVNIDVDVENKLCIISEKLNVNISDIVFTALVALIPDLIASAKTDYNVGSSTELVLQLPEGIVFEIYEVIDSIGFNLSHFVESSFAELITSYKRPDNDEFYYDYYEFDPLELLHQEASNNNNKIYAENTLPFKISIPSDMAFQVGMIAQELNISISQVAKAALYSIYAWGCVYDKEAEVYIRVL